MKKRNVKKKYNRILEISDDAKQITLPDSRYYRRNNEYYPSVTYVLSYYPKGKFFETKDLAPTNDCLPIVTP